MASFGRLRENWLRPFFFFGNNLVSLIGGALTTASAFTLIGFWVVDIFAHEGSDNPYVGIIFDLCLPGLFVLGLILIPIGMWFRRRHLKAAGQLPLQYPPVDLREPRFRRGIEIVVLATFINFIISFIDYFKRILNSFFSASHRSRNSAPHIQSDAF